LQYEESIKEDFGGSGNYEEEGFESYSGSMAVSKQKGKPVFNKEQKQKIDSEM